MHRALIGILAGTVATGCMTAWEFIFYRRYGLEACLDWEINQHLLARVNGKDPHANLGLGLVMHGIVGIGGGVVFAAMLLDASQFSVAAAGLGFGVALWTLLLALPRFATGRGVGQGQLRSLPAVVSLVGHVIYGAALATAVSVASHQ